MRSFALVTVLAMVGGASAFVAPSAGRAARMVTSESVFDDYVGGQGAFVTDYNFDPLGLAEKSPELVPWYRECEIKHGRIAMLAVVGFITAEYVRIPGDMYQGMSVVEAHDALLKNGPMYQLLFWIGLFEMVVTIPACIATSNGERAPGDFNFGMGFAPKDPEKFKLKQIAELKNGRLAMLGFSGMVTQSVLSGHGFPYVY